MTAQLVADALIMAIWRRGRPDALLHHSDRGGQDDDSPNSTLFSAYKLTSSRKIARALDRRSLAFSNSPRNTIFMSGRTLASDPCRAIKRTKPSGSQNYCRGSR